MLGGRDNQEARNFNHMTIARLHHYIPGFRRPYLQRNEARAQRDQALLERDAVRRERDEALRERDEARRERDSARKERDDGLREQNKAQIERDDHRKQFDYLSAAQDDLKRFVQEEAFLWGNDVTSQYFEPAERDFNRQWEIVWKTLSASPIVYTTTLELACGHGRNTTKLAALADNMILVDVNPDNIKFCKNRFHDKPWRFVLNNGFDLREIGDDSVTFIYCFEAAVHFDLEIMVFYIKEFRRVLAPSGVGFVHHSNVSDRPGLDFRSHPHLRNFMSKEIFAHLCTHNGLEMISQQILDWGGPKADCFSVFRKP
jgi:ubiquinone/menaquinone biosynthesis C-methylase UbiE